MTNTGPVLKDIRGTKEITLPEYEGAVVVVYDNVLVGDAIEFDGLSKNPTPGELLKVLPKLIKSWNFTKEDGTPQPITAETIGLLSVESVKIIAEEVAGLITSAITSKKKGTQA